MYSHYLKVSREFSQNIFPITWPCFLFCFILCIEVLTSPQNTSFLLKLPPLIRQFPLVIIFFVKNCTPHQKKKKKKVIPLFTIFPINLLLKIDIQYTPQVVIKVPVIGGVNVLIYIFICLCIYYQYILMYALIYIYICLYLYINIYLYRQKPYHPCQTLSKFDVLLHKTHRKVLLVIRCQGSTSLGL